MRKDLSVAVWFAVTACIGEVHEEEFDAELDVGTSEAELVSLDSTVNPKGINVPCPGMFQCKTKDNAASCYQCCGRAYAKCKHNPPDRVQQLKGCHEECKAMKQAP